MYNSIPSQNSSASSEFSLTELLVVIVMGGILATAGYSLFREQSRINQSQQNLLEMQSNGRAALNFLTQSFVHAGFGCSETNTSFIQLTNGATAQNPDTVTVLYGSDHVATTITESNSTNLIQINTVIGKSVNVNHLVSFYPSVRPNRTYQVTSSGASITLDQEVVFVPAGAKVFRVFPVVYGPNGNILQRTDSVGTDAVAFDVVNFQMAYSTENPPDWKDDTGNVNNARAVWLYLILRTRDRAIGVRHAQTFTLPWNNATSFLASNAEDGYHYQEFQTQVWIRNAN